MPSSEDRSYFQRRARAELAIASTCEDNAAALAHFRLADEYARRVRSMAAPAPTVPSARRS
ncbi:hypothetical protein [Sphingomonas trueperi]|uniref:hypothetical protein n=1 Tax=Sphingomonas trueperi TaxID=53317 RepID=UPI000EB35F18